jgi:hypothetical protein
MDKNASKLAGIVSLKREFTSDDIMNLRACTKVGRCSLTPC